MEDRIREIIKEELFFKEKFERKEWDWKISQLLVDEENKVAAVVILRERWILIGGGMRWREEVYGIKFKEGVHRIRRISAGEASHNPEDGDTGNHYRFGLQGIKNGILRYAHSKRTEFKPFKGQFVTGLVCTRVEDFEKTYDLKDI